MASISQIGHWATPAIMGPYQVVAESPNRGTTHACGKKRHLICLNATGNYIASYIWELKHDVRWKKYWNDAK